MCQGIKIRSIFPDILSLLPKAALSNATNFWFYKMPSIFFLIQNSRTMDLMQALATNNGGFKIETKRLAVEECHGTFHSSVACYQKDRSTLSSQSDIRFASFDL